MANKKEIENDETATVDENEILVKEKQTWKLNPIESVAYEGMKGIFVGAFMIGDFLGYRDKKDGKD
ncbi:MAG: hypothetical protein J6B73_09760 [Methanobrevibacter sp.]|uniref:hypothetical protein n=1 Tax=Methanobrevibacter sp. TaxID=66852 RepID=UPI001B06C6E3|nr:hypothetical protein [Methanobrevibacter sp.]MBO5152428.1 hypothetical protein [Methanobrevibacter sp.]